MLPFMVNGAWCSNAWRGAAEVSSGRSSGAGRYARSAKDQRSRTRQRLWMLDDHVACAEREVEIGA